MSKKSFSSEEEFSIPLDMSDIINVCREFSQLGDNIQYQVEMILEFGLDTSLKEGLIKKETLPAIKRFFQSVKNNAYFGDAAAQGEDIVKQIDKYNFECIYKTAN